MISVSPADDQFIEKLNEVIRARMSDPQFSVPELAREMGMSRSTLHRRIREVTGKPVKSLISEARLDKAMDLLKQRTLNVSEVAWETGFGSTTYFIKSFHDHFGFPPGEARNKIANGNGKNNLIDNDQNVTVNTAEKVRKKRPAGVKLWMLFSALLVLVVLVFLSSEGYLFRPGNLSAKKGRNAEKSIAVLPFINDSPDSANVYFINGVMEGIVNNLARIKNLRVLSRTSVEKFRNNTTKTMREIADELDVQYIVEGSGQKTGDQIVLSVQLVETGRDKHLFSKQYNRKWEDIFTLQSEIATLIANRIEAAITPEEVDLIEKKPTTNTAALNMYLRAMDIANHPDVYNNPELGHQRVAYLRRAVALDSAYADALAELGWALGFIGKSDSILYFADRALHFDDKNIIALLLKSNLFMNSGKLEEAEKNIKLAIRIAPNESGGYWFLGMLYQLKGEMPLTIENLLKAYELQKENSSGGGSLQSLYFNLYTSGFPEEALIFIEKMIEYNNDSSFYYPCMLEISLNRGDYPAALKYAMKVEPLDQAAPGMWKWKPADIALQFRDYQGALKLAGEFIEMYEKTTGKEMYPCDWIGYIYLKNGLKEKSVYHYEGAIKHFTAILEQNKSNPDLGCCTDLCEIYSGMGEKEKAMEYLRKAVKIIDGTKIPLENIRRYKMNPVFDTIRDEPEFREFLRNAEEMWVPDREKIKKLLQEEGLLQEKGSPQSPEFLHLILHGSKC